MYFFPHPSDYDATTPLTGGPLSQDFSVCLTAPFTRDPAALRPRHTLRSSRALRPRNARSAFHLGRTSAHNPLCLLSRLPPPARASPRPPRPRQDSYLEEGFILNKKIGVGQPKRMTKAKILIANTPMDTDKIKIFGSRVRVDSMAKVAEIEAAEKDKMKAKVEKIVAHGINCFVNRQLIYNYPEQLFADAGVLAIEHADFDGVERLAAVTGGEIVSTFDHPELVRLGECELIEEVMIDEERMIRFSGVKAGEACTIVLRGSSSHLLDEAERSLHDALAVLAETVKESRVSFGGGCSEALMAHAVDEEAKRTAGKKQLAMEAFARALRQLPTIIADNAGYDSADLITKVRAEHAAGNIRAGIDIRSGTVGNMVELGIMEALKLKRQVLLSAAEAAEMVLRVDDIVRCAPRRRDDGHGHDH
jgi:T-complex protein 1 subunit beta